MTRNLPQILTLAVIVWAVMLASGFDRQACGADQASEQIGPDSRWAQTADRLRQFITSQLDDKKLGAVSIALVDGPTIVWAEGFGLADPDSATRATAATVYRVGSVSKIVTDLVLMQLVESGQIDLDAPVRTYVSSFQPTQLTGPPITLRHLVAHRSGLVREPPVGHYFDPSEPTLAQTVASLNQTSLVYPPGSRTKYSNAGIAVVGHVLSHIVGRPFESWASEHLLAPLEMHSSSFQLTAELRSRLCRATMWTHDGREFPAPTFQLGTVPAGNLYSTVTDLGNLVAMILDEGRFAGRRVFEAQTISEMLRPQFDPNNTTDNFGVGFHLGRLDGHRMAGHGGAVYGFSTQVSILPDQRLGVVAVAARDVSNTTVGRITDYALRCMLAVSRRAGTAPLPEPPQATAPVDPLQARQLDGLFVSDDGKSLRLIERNGQLLAEMDSFRARLRTLDGDLIVDDVHEYGPRIQVTDPGTLTVEGRVFARRDEPRPAPLSQAWEGLVGEYGWDHNTLFIYERGGQLHCLIEWFFQYPLAAIDDHRFAFPDYGLYHGEQLVFERDETGVARKVVAAGVPFDRRPVGQANGRPFQIRPVAPIPALRESATRADPPPQPGGLRTPDLVELASLDPSIRLDIRYATNENFLGEPVYQQARAFLQRPAAEALVRVQKRLRPMGLGILVFDAYRPWYVTRIFWDATPQHLKIFVADPQQGSRHNRGCAVDLTLCDLQTGQPVDMGAGYDEFSPRSFPDYPVASDRARWHRERLRDAMEAEGFTIYEYEWWHFDYRDWQKYPILNIPFAQIHVQR